MQTMGSCKNEQLQLYVFRIIWKMADALKGKQRRTGKTIRFVKASIRVGQTRAIDWGGLVLHYEYCNHSRRSKKSISKRNVTCTSSLDSIESQTETCGPRCGRTSETVTAITSRFVSANWSLDTKAMLFASRCECVRLLDRFYFSPTT